MDHYAGLDVSLRLTAICVLDERGRVVLEGKVHSSPAAIADFLQPYGSTLKLAGLEAGLLAPYLYSGLLERGLPAVCIETRRMKAFAKASPVKTDRKDAHLIALAIKAGLYRAVHVKSDQSQRLRFLLTARELLMRQVRQLEETMRGSFKAFGLRMGKIGRRQFAERARELARDQGLLLVLGRLKRSTPLKEWGLNIAARRGTKRARVAVARKLAVILHRMWIDGTNFQWNAAPMHAT